MQVGGSIINQTVVHNPELTQMLPEGWEHRLDSVLNNTYTYGRQGLSNLVSIAFFTIKLIIALRMCRLKMCK